MIVFIAGVLIADYFVLRRTHLVADDLYRRGGEYEYSRGVNGRAVIALVAGVALALVGLAVKPLASDAYPPGLRLVARFLYACFNYAWFVGFGGSFAVYLALMRRARVAQRFGHRAAQPRVESIR